MTVLKQPIPQIPASTELIQYLRLPSNMQHVPGECPGVGVDHVTVCARAHAVQLKVVSIAAPVEWRLRRSAPRLPPIKPDRLKSAKALVETAVKVITRLYRVASVRSPLETICSPVRSQLRKVFSVHGRYPVIRDAMWARGWVERRWSHAAHRAAHCHCDDDEEEDGDVSAGVVGEARR